jgi:Ca2+-binding EF-hand superfamily protein
MISRRTALLNILVLGSVLGAGLPAFGEARRPSTIQKFDTDNDGTLDLNEVKKAGSALFDKLDRDHDGTLDRRELRGRLSAKEFAAADPDKDGTLTKDEYLAVVEQRFKAADPDNDGTLDAKELSNPAGRASCGCCSSQKFLCNMSGAACG